MAEAVRASESGEQSVELGGKTPSPMGRSGRAGGLRCSFCQAPLGQENETMAAGTKAHGQRVEQNLLADIRWPCARAPADIVSFSWSSAA